jgi:hypothetical protein
MRARPSTFAGAETFVAIWPSHPDWWSHATTDGIAANECAHRACVAIAAQTQTFAGRRLETDTHVLQELTSAKAPVEVWNARYRFWQRATEDYGAEWSMLAKLIAGSIPMASSEPRTVASGTIESRLTTPWRRPCTSTS